MEKKLCLRCGKENNQKSDPYYCFDCLGEMHTATKAMLKKLSDDYVKNLRY